MVTYAGGSTNTALLSATAPSVGDSVNYGGATTTSANDYAIGVVVAPSMCTSKCVDYNFLMYICQLRNVLKYVI